MNKKMKKILASLTAAATMSSVFLTPLADISTTLGIRTIEASAADVVISGDYAYYVNDNGVVINNYIGTAAEVSIPAEIDGNKTTFVIEYWQASAEGARETAKTLKVGDKIDVEGFLYWYNGPQTHVTGITIAD